MDNTELLKALEEKIKSGEIDKKELKKVEKSSHKIDLVKLLYGVGGLILLFGIFHILAIFWDELGDFVKILISYLISFSVFLTGLYLVHINEKSKLGEFSVIIGGSAITLATYFTLDVLEAPIDSLWLNSFVFGSFFVFYYMLNLYFKNISLVISKLIYGSLFAYITFAAFIEELSAETSDLYFMFIFAMGISYILLSRYYAASLYSSISGILNFGGSSFVLGSMFYFSVTNKFFELIYIIFPIALITLSTKIKSKSMLVVSFIAIFSYNIYLIGVHMADVVLWPLILIFEGLVLMALGKIIFEMNKKYFKKEEQPFISN